MDECGQNSASQHVVLFTLLPKQRQILYQAADIRSYLPQDRKRETTGPFSKKGDNCETPDKHDEVLGNKLLNLLN